MFKLSSSWLEADRPLEGYPPDWVCTREGSFESGFYRLEHSLTPVVILRGRREGDGIDYLVKVTMASSERRAVEEVSLGMTPVSPSESLIELSLKEGGGLNGWGVIDWKPSLHLAHLHRELTVSVYDNKRSISLGLGHRQGTTQYEV